MFIIVIWPLLAAFLGLVLYLVASKPEVKRVGEILLFAGILVTLFVVATHVVRIG